MTTVSWNGALPWRRATSQPPDDDLKRLATAPGDLTIYARMDPQCLGAQGLGARRFGSCFCPLRIFMIGGSSSNLFFSRGWVRTSALEKPVISIGNLTVGGTGNPSCLWLARELNERGSRLVSSAEDIPEKKPCR